MSDFLQTPTEQANIIIIQGDDALSIQETIHNLTGLFDGGAFAGLNSVRLDGRVLQRGDLANSVNALPLGGEKRLVILDNSLDSFTAKADQDWLTDLITSMPETTTLVMLVPDSQKYQSGGMVWITVTKKHWLFKILNDSGKIIKWVEKPLPTLREMPEWIMQEASRQGAQMDRQAATALANLVGNDTFQVRQEIGKAINYNGKETPITRDIVALLCSKSREETVFDMVDAAGQRNGSKALGLLRELMQDQPTQFIFTMLIRQVRLLLIARETLDEQGGKDAVVAACGVAPFIADKLINQCRRFSLQELETILQHLDRLDETSKNGTATLEVGLETFIAELSR